MFRVRFSSSNLLFAASLPLLCVGMISGLSNTSQAKGKQVGPNQEQVIALGKELFFDTELSNPEGMSCATCHTPGAGSEYPISNTNEYVGPVPGAVSGRFGNRRPPTVAYAAFLPQGAPTFVEAAHAYVGGLFWDGRAPNLTDQAMGPLVNPNEMNNLVNNQPSEAMVVSKVQNGRFGPFFQAVYGSGVWTQSTDAVYRLIAQTIAAYEASPEVSPFSSKYDAYLAGKAKLSAAELDGLRLFTGSWSGRPGGAAYPTNARCVTCHTIPSAPGSGTDLFTSSVFVNLGVPRNLANPYYEMTNAAANPAGYNPLGGAFVDYGLGDFLYPQLGKPSGDLGENDPLAIDGTFKAPTLRNVDNRPYAGFVKDYEHNGVFKSLEQVVHFYNTRNLTTVQGEIIDFTKNNPYAGLKGKPLWPQPEYMSAKTIVNPKGGFNSSSGLVGNLGLSVAQELDLVAFLKTLTDGYFAPGTE
jgi:cytochrome c peroxidase